MAYINYAFVYIRYQRQPTDSKLSMVIKQFCVELLCYKTTRVLAILKDDKKEDSIRLLFKQRKMCPAVVDRTVRVATNRVTFY